MNTSHRIKHARLRLPSIWLSSNSESELAFAVAHEIGHVIQFRTNFTKLSTDNLELDADFWGLLLSLVAGYDPYAGAGTLAKLAMANGNCVSSLNPFYTQGSHADSGSDQELSHATSDHGQTRRVVSGWKNFPGRIGLRLCLHAMRNAALFHADEAMSTLLSVSGMDFWEIRREIALLLKDRAGSASQALVSQVKERIRESSDVYFYRYTIDRTWRS